MDCRALEIGPHGPLHDRAWMVVDADDTTQFATQRGDPRLALVEPSIGHDALVTTAEGMSPLRVWRDRWDTGERLPTKVHKAICWGADQGAEAADWFSELLGRRMRLLRMLDDDLRVPNRVPVDVASAGLKFADGYPILLTTDTSLNALNVARSAEIAPFTMDLFRPNIMVTGSREPWEEETWRRFRCGEVPMHGAKPCDRCSIITTHQQTGARTPRHLGELLRIHYGLRDGKKVPLFGMNLIPAHHGTIRLGDPIGEITYGPRPEL